MALPSTLIFDYPTARQLAGYFEEQAGGEGDWQIRASGSGATRDAAQSRSQRCARCWHAGFRRNGAATLAELLGLSSCGTPAPRRCPDSRWSLDPSAPMTTTSRAARAARRLAARRRASSTTHSSRSRRPRRRRWTRSSGCCSSEGTRRCMRRRSRRRPSWAASPASLSASPTLTTATLSRPRRSAALYTRHGQQPLGGCRPHLLRARAAGAMRRLRHRLLFRARGQPRCDARGPDERVHLGLVSRSEYHAPARGRTHLRHGWHDVAEGSCHTFDSRADGYCRGEAMLLGGAAARRRQKTLCHCLSWAAACGRTASPPRSPRRVVSPKSASCKPRLPTRRQWQRRSVLQRLTEPGRGWATR